MSLYFNDVVSIEIPKQSKPRKPRAPRVPKVKLITPPDPFKLKAIPDRIQLADMLEKVSQWFFDQTGELPIQAVLKPNSYAHRIRKSDKEETRISYNFKWSTTAGLNMSLSIDPWNSKTPLRIYGDCPMVNSVTDGWSFRRLGEIADWIERQPEAIQKRYTTAGNHGVIKIAFDHSYHWQQLKLDAKKDIGNFIWCLAAMSDQATVWSTCELAGDWAFLMDAPYRAVTARSEKPKEGHASLWFAHYDRTKLKTSYRDVDKVIGYCPWRAHEGFTHHKIEIVDVRAHLGHKLITGDDLCGMCSKQLECITKGRTPTTVPMEMMLTSSRLQQT